jgi:hypothetical protein
VAKTKNQNIVRIEKYWEWIFEEKIETKKNIPKTPKNQYLKKKSCKEASN